MLGPFPVRGDATRRLRPAPPRRRRTAGPVPGGPGPDHTRVRRVECARPVGGSRDPPAHPACGSGLPRPGGHNRPPSPHLPESVMSDPHVILDVVNFDTTRTIPTPP